MVPHPTDREVVAGTGHEIRVFGSTTVEMDGSTLKLTNNMRRMLCLIVAAGPDGISIDRALTEAADGDASAKAQSRVRMDVSRLRKRIGAHLLPNAAGVWRLNAEASNVDFFDLQLAQQRPVAGGQATANLLRGEPFQDATPSPLIDEASQLVRTTRLDLLRRMLDEPEKVDLASLHAARRLTDNDPLNEELIAVVIEHHIAAGHLQAAREILGNAFVNFHEMLQLDLPEELRAFEDQLGATRATLPGSGVPQTSKHASRKSSELVGRKEEQGRIRTWIDHGGRAPVLVTGPSGSGKTALLEELAESARQHGLRVAQVVAREHDSRPYHPFLRLLSSEFEAIVETSTAPAEVWASATDELASGESSTPTVLIVDDAQWLDSLSHQLVMFLLDSNNPGITTVLAGRAVEGGLWGDIDQRYRTRGIEPLELGTLSLAELQTLVQRRRPGVSVSQSHQLASEVLAASDGLPAIAIRLIDGAHGPTLELPTQVGSHGLSWFVESLPSHAREVAVAASVLGGHLSYPELAELSQLEASELFEALEVLSARGVLVSQATPGQMSFAHALVREAFHDSAPADTLRALQRRAAQVTQNPHRRAELLAESEPTMAAAALLDSADLHLKSGSVVEAARAYEAADGLDPANSSAESLARWAGAAERVGLDGAELRQRAFDQAMNDGSLEHALAAAASGLPEGERPAGDPDRISLLEEIDASLLTGRDRFVHAVTLSRQYAVAGRAGEALNYVELAAELADADTDTDAVARVKWLASYSTTSPVQRLANADFYPVDPLPDSARLLYAIDHLGSGQVDQADGIRSAIADRLDPASDPTSYWHGLMIRSTIAAARGNASEAKTYADDALDFAMTYGIREAGTAWLAQTFTIAWMFEPAGAADYLAGLTELPTVDIEDSFLAQTTLALGLHQHGDHVAAKELAEHLVSIALDHHSYAGVATIALCARILGPDTPKATDMITLLEPQSGSLLVLGSGFISVGPADLAIAHLCTGAERQHHLERALRLVDNGQLQGWKVVYDRESQAFSEGARSSP